MPDAPPSAQPTGQPAVPALSVPGASATGTGSANAGLGATALAPAAPALPGGPASAAVAAAAATTAATPTAGQSGLSSAEQDALKGCMQAVDDYCAGRLAKTVAIGKCMQYLQRAKLPMFGFDEFLARMDNHDFHRSRAAQEGAARAAALGFGGGNPVPPPRLDDLRKRTRALADAGASSSDDSDPDDDDKRPYKRSAAGFRHARTFGTLAPGVRETLRIRDNYLADLKRAKRDLLLIGFAPPFPDDFWEGILADRFIDFGKILARRFATRASDGTSHRLNDNVSITLNTPELIKVVADQSDWQNAFDDWCAALLFAYPHRQSELDTYRQFVGDLFRSTHKDHHARVIAADAAIRSEVANHANLTFADTTRHRSTADRTLGSFGAEAALVQPTFAPFPTAFGTANTSIPGPQSNLRWRPSGQICKNFNGNRCAHPQCRHAHVCSICHNVGHSAVDHAAALDEHLAPEPSS